MNKVSLVVLTTVLLLVSTFTAFSLQLPGRNAELKYNNEGSSQRIDIDKIETEEINVTLNIYVLFIYDLSTDTAIVVLRLGYEGNHGNESKQARFDELPKIVINNQMMEIVKHEPTEPEERNFDFFRGNYEVITAELKFSRLYLMQHLDIVVDGSISLFSIANESIIHETDLSDFNYEKNFIIFNKPGFLLLSLLFWMGLSIPILRQYRSKFTTDDKNSKYTLAFVANIFPSILIAQAALFFAPLGYLSSSTLVDENRLVPADDLIIGSLLVILFNLIVYFVIPTIYDFRKNKNVYFKPDKYLTIHTPMLKKLEVPKKSSEKGFFITVKERIWPRLFFGIVVIQLINIVSIFMLSEATSLSFLFAPIIYIYWIISRDNIFKGYIGKNPKWKNKEGS